MASEFTFRPIYPQDKYEENPGAIENTFHVNNSFPPEISPDIPSTGNWNQKVIPENIPTEVSNSVLLKQIFITNQSINNVLNNQSIILDELERIKQDQTTLKNIVLSNFLLLAEKDDELREAILNCEVHIDTSENKVRRSFKEHFETMARFQEQIRDQFLEKIKEREQMEKSGLTRRNRGSSSSGDDSGKGIWDLLKFFFDIGTNVIITNKQSEMEGRKTNRGDLLNVVEFVANHSYVKESKIFNDERYKPVYNAIGHVLTNTLYPDEEKKRPESNSSFESLRRLSSISSFPPTTQSPSITPLSEQNTLREDIPE